MSSLLLLTSALQPSAEVMPALALLGHGVKILPAEGSALLEAPDADLILVDGRQDLAHARDLCRLIRTTGSDAPVLLVVTEGGLAVVAVDWGMDDVVLHTCGPAELEVAGPDGIEQRAQALGVRVDVVRCVALLHPAEVLAPAEFVGVPDELPVARRAERGQRLR